MSFSHAIATCMGKYATFSGRASRSEFWWFQLFVVLMSWGAQIVGATQGGPELAFVLSQVVGLAFLFPVLAVGTRRLHDVGRSGW